MTYIRIKDVETPLEIHQWWYVYVLRSEKDKCWYTGYTQNLKKRLSQHNQGKSLSTKNRGPFQIIYSEAGLNLDDAKAREKYLKSGMGKRYIKNRLKNYLINPGISNGEKNDGIHKS